MPTKELNKDSLECYRKSLKGLGHRNKWESEKPYVNILLPDLISAECFQGSSEKRPSDDLVEAAYNLHIKQ